MLKNKNLSRLASLALSALLLISATACSAGVATDDAADSGYRVYNSSMTAAGATNSFYSSKAESEGILTDDVADMDYYAPSESFKGEQVAPESKPDFSGRKIIYSSWYDIQTEQYDTARAALDALCEKYGAYYESAESYGDGSEYSARRAHFVIRVPQQNYKSFIKETGTVGTVTSSGESNEDISEQYYDTEARLESAKLREERLLEILSKADLLDDVLLLERELSDVRYEIENYAGTLKRYDSLVNYSTATVNLREVIKITPPDSKKLTLGERMSAATSRGLDNLRAWAEDMLVGMSYNLPSFIIVFLPIVVIFILILSALKKRRKKRAQRKAAKVAKEEAEDSGEEK